MCQLGNGDVWDSNDAPPLTRCSPWYQEAESPVNHVLIRHECAPRTIVHEEHHCVVSANGAGVDVDMTVWSDADTVTTGGPALVKCAGTHSRRWSTCLCWIMSDCNCTWWDMGPLCTMTVPVLNCDLSQASQIITVSPTANLWNWGCASCQACFRITFLSNSWCNRSKRVRIGCPKNNDAEGCPVVAWGILQYNINNLCSWCCKDNPLHSPAFMACLKVWPNLSTAPLDDGW